MKICYLFHEPTSLAMLASRMAHLAALGYHGVELSATHPLALSIESVIELSQRHNLPVVSLLSGWSYANEGLCLSSPNGEVRGRAIQRLREYVGFAARLGSVLVVGMMQGTLGDEPDAARANDRIAECLELVALTAAEQGVQVVLEPVNHQIVGFNHTAAEAAHLVERVGVPALGYMLDTIHMHIEERSVVDTIRTYGANCKHFHLCETNGGPFGSGGLDFPTVLHALETSGYRGVVSVKIYRNRDWKDAAVETAGFLRHLGVRLRED